MAPTKSKLTTEAATGDKVQKTIDALWLFDQFMHCDPPLILNVAGIAEATGVKPNTIVKRIHTLKQRYPGLGIITRTTGPRQSSNLVATVSSPKVVAPSPANRIRRKDVSKADEEEDEAASEEDEAEETVRMTRAKSRIGQVQTEDETDKRSLRRRSRASTVDQVAVQETPPKFQKTVPKNVSKTSRKAHHHEESIESNNKAVDHDIEVHPKQAATPKTRGGRKSAGLGELEKSCATSEKLQPRGRHAGPKKDDVANEKEELAEQGRNTNTTPLTTVSGLRRMPASLSPSTKRKRSGSATPPSSPLTPSLKIMKRLDSVQNTDQDAEERQESNADQALDMNLPAKKRKVSILSTSENIVSDVALVATDVLSTPENDLNLEPCSQEAVRSPQIEDDSQSNDITQSETAQPGNVTAQIDSASEMMNVEQNSQVEDTSVREERSTTRRTESDQANLEPEGSDPPRDFADSQSESGAEVQTTCQEEFHDPDSSFRTAEAPLKPKDITSVTNAMTGAVTESRKEIERSQKSPMRSIFRKPLEWMVWVPAKKSANDAGQDARTL